MVAGGDEGSGEVMSFVTRLALRRSVGSVRLRRRWRGGRLTTPKKKPSSASEERQIERPVVQDRHASPRAKRPL